MSTYTKNLSLANGTSFATGLQVFLDLGDQLIRIDLKGDGTADCTFEQAPATPAAKPAVAPGGPSAAKD